MDALKGIELSKLRSICRSVLAHEEEESKSESKEEETKSESKSEPKQKENDDGWTPADSGNTYVFVGTSDAHWPTTKPGRGRSARKKEQSDA